MKQLFGYTIFCDDIRNEVGGKISLIGVYAAHLVVENDFPVRLPKFGFHVVLMIPREKQITSVKVMIFLPKADGKEDEKADIEGDLTLQPSKTDEAKTDRPPYMKLTQNMLFSDVLLSGPGRIKVRASCNGELLKLGTVQVVTREATQARQESLKEMPAAPAA